jgi:hypothetical protein
MRVFGKLGAALAVVALLVTAAGADERDRLTYLTFSGPVQLPGVTLTAGTYTFRLADLEGDRHVVQVLRKDDSKLIATVLTIPNKLLDAPKDPYVMFEERPAGSPQAMKAWFYPGNSIGEEFIYPKKQAVAIAKANHEPVLATDADTANSRGGKVARVDENGKVAGESASASSSSAPAREQADTTRRDAPSAPATVSPRSAAPPSVGTSGQSSRAARSTQTAPSSAGTTRSRLPQTSSELGLLQLLSGLFVAGGLGIRWFRRQS